MRRPITNHGGLRDEWDRLEAMRISLEKVRISNENATTCAFLRLPAEIRNNIYQRVFDELNVEIRIKGDPKISKHVIQLKRTERLSVMETGLYVHAKGVATPMLPRWAAGNMDPSCERHPQAIYGLRVETYQYPDPLSEVAQLQLLATTLVCKQMYLDTALLPFQYFTFSSEHLNWLTSWMQLRLLPPQRNAITVLKMRLELVTFHSWATMKPILNSCKAGLKMEPAAMKMLASYPHLKRLVLTDFDSWTNWSRPTDERVQEIIREATGMRKLVLVRSEEKMFGGG